MLLFKLDMSIGIVLYKWHKIKVFNICFSPIVHFISAYPIFCKNIASTDIHFILSLYTYTSFKNFYNNMFIESKISKKLLKSISL